MKPLILTSTPARIDDYRSTAASPTTKEGGPTPIKAKTIDVTLDVTNDVDALDAVWPGIKHALQGAASQNDTATGERAASFTWTVARKLPPLTVRLTDTIGDLVLSAVNAKTKGKPTLRVSAGVDRIEIPLCFVAALDEDGLRRMEEHLGVDLFADVGASQVDLIDEPQGDDDDAPAPPPKPARRRKATTTVDLVDNA